MDTPDISVVIPVKNGEKYLSGVLKGIFSQGTSHKVEVIIIDSGSSDKTLDIVSGYPVKLWQIKEGEFNHGLTRNLGISKSKGRYIILMTADAVPYDNYWIRNLVGDLENDSVVAGVYSRQIPHKNSTFLTQMRVNRFFTSSTEKRVSQIEQS